MKTYGYAPRPDELKSFSKVFEVKPDEITYRRGNGLELGALAISALDWAKVIIIGINQQGFDGSVYDVAYPNSNGKTTVLHWTQLNVMDRD